MLWLVAIVALSQAIQPTSRRNRARETSIEAMSTLYNIDVRTLSNVVAGVMSQIQQQNPINTVMPTIPSTTVATLPGPRTTSVSKIAVLPCTREYMNTSIIIL